MELSDRLLKRLEKAYSVAVLTGAGISASSGIPTFRSKDGIWKKFKPEELANYNAFVKNPKLVWEWYGWRRNLIKNVRPNPAHYALVDLENIFKDFAVITQNVDNLHSLAGSNKLIELHGNIMRNKCIECGKPFEGDFNLKEGIPKCTTCGGMIRPDVVWFGENLPEDQIMAAQELAMRCEVFFSIGTSSIVEPAASLPYMAKGNGAYLVEINIEETPLTGSANEFIQGPADKILPELIVKLQDSII
jgi:NAD-dependent deacetylase